MDCREEALQILSELTPLRIKKQQSRTRQFIASPKADPPTNLFPQDWSEGWCSGWAFAVQPSMAEVMDICIVTRSKTEKMLDTAGKPVLKRNPDGSVAYKSNGIPEYEVVKTAWQEWSQGSWFDFREGYTFHDAPEAYTLPWSEALSYIKCSLRIIDAISATPAIQPKPERKATATLPYRAGTEEVLRFRGEVTFGTYRPNAAGTNLESFGEPRTVSQDEFMRILIAGLPNEWM